jgi:hypothetical protein
MVKRAGGVTNNDKLVNDLAQEVGLLLLVVKLAAANVVWGVQYHGMT